MSDKRTHMVYEAIAKSVRSTADHSLEQLRAEVKRAWEAAGPVRADHGFLTMRRIRAYSARQAGSRLMVPLFDAGGALCALVTIEPNSRTEVVGDMSQPGVRVPLMPEATRISQSTIVCTSLPDGCAIHAATGEPVLCAITAANAAHVAREVRAMHPERQILLVDDEGGDAPGLLAAVADEIGATILRPRHVIVDIADSFLTLHMRYGPDALRDVISKAGNAAFGHTTDDTPARAVRPEQAHGSKLQRAKALLMRLLTPTCPTRRIEAEAKLEGISFRVIEQARAQLVSDGLPIRAHREGSIWAWTMDGAPSPQQSRT